MGKDRHGQRAELADRRSFLEPRHPVDLRRFHLGCHGGKVEHADGHGDRFPQLHEPLRLALYAAFLDFAKPVAGLRKSRAGI